MINSDVHIYMGAAERLNSLKQPDHEEKITVISTPFDIEGEAVLLGKRSQGHLIALFPNSGSRVTLHSGPKRLTNGFEVLESELKRAENETLSKYIELRNIGSIDSTLFGAVLDEVLSNLDAPGSDLIEKIQAVLEKWKNMLSLDSERILPLNAIVGLMGEIKLLSHLLSGPASNAFKNWVGPQGNRHDFEFESTSIEVKTTTSKVGNEITIHGLNQLDPYPGKLIYLFKIRIELDPAGISLPQLIQEVIQLNLVPESDLMDKLSQVGYKSTQKSMYEEICFQFTEFQVIPVSSNFPNITRESLNPIDDQQRIQDIQYVVNTTGLESQKSQKITTINFEGML